MKPARRLGLARAVALAVPALALGGAWLAQYGFGYAPCEMCWWQRYPHYAALALAVAAAFVPAASRPMVVRMLVAGAAGGALTSALIGLYHAGVEWDWWQGLTACTGIPQASAGVDALDAILNAPIVRCDRPAFTVLGLSMAGWNFLWSGLGGLTISVLLTGARR